MFQFKLMAYNKGQWQYEKGHHSLSGLLVYTHELYRHDMWRILRIADNVVIVASKEQPAPAATPSPEPTPEPVASEPQAAPTVGDEPIVILNPHYEYELQIYKAKQWMQHESSNSVSLLMPYVRWHQSTIPQIGYNWRIVRASDLKIIAQKYIPQAAHPVADEAVSSSAIPVADDKPIFLDTRGGKLITLHGKPFLQTIWTHRNPGGGNIVSGHNRGKKRTQSRKNSPKIGQFKAKGSPKVYPSMNIERRTPEAANWRNKRHLANRVAMPIPTITGAELLQQAGLTLLPKPKRLTRHLEGRRAA